MHAHLVLVIDDDGPRSSTVAEHDVPLSGIGWLPDDRLLVVAMDGTVLRLDPSGLVVHADVTALVPHGINDMIVHPEGWAWVGQFGYDRHAGATPAPSPLIRVDPDGTASVAADDLNRPAVNGMAITPDGATLIVAESAGRQAHDVRHRHERRPVRPRRPRRVAARGRRHVPRRRGRGVGGVRHRGRGSRALPGGEIVDTVEFEPPRRTVVCGARWHRPPHPLHVDCRHARRGRPVAVNCGPPGSEQVQVDVPGAGRP